jgi:replicative DNA helicase
MATAPTTPSSAQATEQVRIPPHDLDAEMATLGSMMLDRQAVEAVLEVINREEAEWFYRPDHRVVFQVLLDVYDRGDPIDLYVVQDELKRRDQLDQVGGTDYIISLAESVPTWVNAEYYARIVRDKGLLRDVIACVGHISESAYADAEPVAEILDAAESAFFLVTERRISRRAAALGEMLEQVYSKIEIRDGDYLTGLPTGFHELDDLTSGLQPGDMIIVAGRPSMGKTALGLTIATHMAVDEKRPVAFFSMEMSNQQLAQRILCSRGGIDSHLFRRGMLSESQVADLGLVCGQLGSAPMYVDDTPSLTALELRGKARRLRQQHRISAVFVDYLQLMHAPTVKESRQQEITVISRALKALARELNIPVIAMAQLNRQAEGREGHRPRMSDLRESGAIEQDADVVLLLHRDEYFHPDDPAAKGIAEVIIAKQRNGPTGNVQLHFNSRLARFDNLARNPSPADVVGSDADAPF